MRPDEARFAERRERAGREGYRDVHDVDGMIDDRCDRSDLGERVAEAAEVIDDARLRGAQVGGGRGIARLEADHLLRQVALRKLVAAELTSANGAQLEQRAWLDFDDDRRRRAAR